MAVRAYVYIESDHRTLCFKCAVEGIVTGSPEDFNLVLEEGSAGDGYDMRATPRCDSCGKLFQDFRIA